MAPTTLFQQTRLESKPELPSHHLKLYSPVRNPPQGEHGIKLRLSWILGDSAPRCNTLQGNLNDNSAALLGKCLFVHQTFIPNRVLPSQSYTLVQWYPNIRFFSSHFELSLPNPETCHPHHARPDLLPLSALRGMDPWLHYLLCICTK